MTCAASRSPLRGLVHGLAALVLTVALGSPAAAQGKSQQSHGKGGQGKPSQSVLPGPSGGGGASPGTAAAPFAWLDNAALLPAGLVWVGFSVTRWQGGGLSEVNVPVVDAAVGLTPRLQFGASVPRIAASADAAEPGASLGTAFFNVKIAAYQNDARGVGLAVAPTIEVLSQAAAVTTTDGQSRTQFGLPVSLDIRRGLARFYGSTGYFSPGVWFAGAGVTGMVSQRVGMALSFSRAWSSASAVDPTAAASRNDVSGSVSFDIASHVGLFGSIGRTIGTAVEQGAGTTLSVGVSLTAGPVRFVE